MFARKRLTKTVDARELQIGQCDQYFSGSQTAPEMDFVQCLS
jgi:hypothetical protein